MNSSRIIRIFYTIYTLYTLFMVSISNYKPIYAFAGIAGIWLCYFVFRIGVGSGDKKKINDNTITLSDNSSIPSFFPLSNIGHWGPLKLFVAFLLSIICSVLAAKFYTGKDITAVINGIFNSGSSAYYSYQQFFANNNIDSFSISKIPYILMLAYSTIILIWGYLGILLENRKIRLSQLLFLIGVTISYLYFGLARGTNFEAFIIFITLSYCIFCRTQVTSKAKRRKYYLLFVVLALLLVSAFRFVISNRGVNYSSHITDEIILSEESVFCQTFPMITGVAVSLFGYIGFGIFTSGVTIVDVFFKSTKSFMALFFPLGYDFIYNQQLRSIVDARVNIGVRWFPDGISLIGMFGLLLFFALIYAMGRFVKIINRRQYPILLKNAINLLVFIEMLSLPIGNFLATSSSNKLMIVFVAIWLIVIHVSREKNNLKENDGTEVKEKVVD